MYIQQTMQQISTGHRYHATMPSVADPIHQKQGLRRDNRWIRVNKDYGDIKDGSDLEDAGTDTVLKRWR